MLARFHTGSSPRVRGAGRETSQGRKRHGIIPARAGSSGPAAARSPRTEDHPRACGEQMTMEPQASVGFGSSPRVRGAGAQHHVDPRPRRIIPARAGSSVRLPSRGRRSSDHPRACGEQHAWATRAKVSSGSSPRVRGAGRDRGRRGCEGRIIPARAGSSSDSITRCLHVRDHPRACGEQVMTRVAGCVPLGSSPRVRGAVRYNHLYCLKLGIIPARAGSRRPH